MHAYTFKIMTSEQLECTILAKQNQELVTQKMVIRSSSNSNDPYLEKNLLIRRSTLSDAPNIMGLYKKVVSIHQDRLTQEIDEITLPYIQSILQQAHLRGLALVMFVDGKLVGFLKAYTSEFRRQAHILMNVTVMIEPTLSSQGFGTLLWRSYLQEVQEHMRHIQIMEILPHASNTEAIRIYEKKGFKLLATLPNKIRYENGTFGAQLVMYITNPNFCNQVLLQYHTYLQKLIKGSYSALSKL